MAVREVEDRGFDAEKRVPPPLPSELIAVEPREARAGADSETATPPTNGPWRNRSVVAIVLLVFVVEIVWLATLGYWFVRGVF